MITFKKVRYKNFLSTGQQFIEIDLANHKTTLVVGENGAGKYYVRRTMFWFISKTIS